MHFRLDKPNHSHRITLDMSSSAVSNGTNHKIICKEYADWLLPKWWCLGCREGYRHGICTNQRLHLNLENRLIHRQEMSESNQISEGRRRKTKKKESKEFILWEEFSTYNFTDDLRTHRLDQLIYTKGPFNFRAIEVVDLQMYESRIGYIVVQIVPPSRNPIKTINIVGLYVREEERRNGVARRLVKEAVELCLGAQFDILVGAPLQRDLHIVQFKVDTEYFKAATPLFEDIAGYNINNTNKSITCFYRAHRTATVNKLISDVQKGNAAPKHGNVPSFSSSSSSSSSNGSSNGYSGATDLSSLRANVTTSKDLSSKVKKEKSKNKELTKEVGKLKQKDDTHVKTITDATKKIDELEKELKQAQKALAKSKRQLKKKDDDISIQKATYLQRIKSNNQSNVSKIKILKQDHRNQIDKVIQKQQLSNATKMKTIQNKYEKQNKTSIQWMNVYKSALQTDIQKHLSSSSSSSSSSLLLSTTNSSTSSSSSSSSSNSNTTSSSTSTTIADSTSLRVQAFIRAPRVEGKGGLEYPIGYVLMAMEMLESGISSGQCEKVLVAVLKHIDPGGIYEIPKRRWWDEHRHVLGELNKYLTAMEFLEHVEQSGTIFGGNDESTVDGIAILAVTCVLTGVEGKEGKELNLSGGLLQAVGTAAAVADSVESVLDGMRSRLKKIKEKFDSLNLTSTILVGDNWDQKLLIKFQGFVHDNCSTANLTGKELKKRWHKYLKEEYTPTELNSMPEHLKLYLDLPCNNHLRVLLPKRYETESQRELKDRLSKFLDGVDQNYRLTGADLTIPALIRSIDKLLRKTGLALYQKGDGMVGWKRYLEDFCKGVLGPHGLGRGSHGNRMGYTFDISELIIGYGAHIADYCNKKMEDDNEIKILRGSIYCRIVNPWFKAELMVRALLNKLILVPMRGVFNSKNSTYNGVTVGPLWENVRKLMLKVQQDPQYLITAFLDNPYTVWVLEERFKITKAADIKETMATNLATGKHVKGTSIEKVTRDIMVKWFTSGEDRGDGDEETLKKSEILDVCMSNAAKAFLASIDYSGNVYQEGGELSSSVVTQAHLVAGQNSLMEDDGSERVIGMNKHIRKKYPQMGDVERHQFTSVMLNKPMGGSGPRKIKSSTLTRARNKAIRNNAISGSQSRGGKYRRRKRERTLETLETSEIAQSPSSSSSSSSLSSNSFASSIPHSQLVALLELSKRKERKEERVLETKNYNQKKRKYEDAKIVKTNAAKQKKVDTQINDWKVPHIRSVAELDIAIGSKSKSDAIVLVLLKQTRLRANGCKFKYNFNDSKAIKLFATKGISDQDRYVSLYDQLVVMIGEENQDNITKAKYTKPLKPPIPGYATANLIVLGAKPPKIQQRHQNEAKIKIDRMSVLDWTNSTEYLKICEYFKDTDKMVIITPKKTTLLQPYGKIIIDKTEDIFKIKTTQLNVKTELPILTNQKQNQKRGPTIMLEDGGKSTPHALRVDNIKRQIMAYKQKIHTIANGAARYTAYMAINVNAMQIHVVDPFDVRHAIVVPLPLLVPPGKCVAVRFSNNVVYYATSGNNNLIEWDDPDEDEDARLTLQPDTIEWVTTGKGKNKKQIKQTTKGTSFWIVCSLCCEFGSKCKCKGEIIDGLEIEEIIINYQ